MPIFTAVVLLALTPAAAATDAIEPLAADILAQCKQQVGSISPCHYAQDVDRSIFSPPFVLFINRIWPRRNEFISTRSGPDEGLNDAQMRMLVDRWQAAEKNLRDRFSFNETHFKKMAGLCPPSNGQVRGNDVALLHRWLKRNGNLPKVADPGPPLTSGQFETLAPKRGEALLKLLKTVDADPIGRTLLRAALERGVQITVRSLSDIQAYYHPQDKQLVLDNSILESEWKIHVLVHELVHAANKDPANSIIEEAVAQIIGSGVQDRITGVPMACHPYYVFADRLLRYEGLQTLNNIRGCLEQIGIDCPSNAPPVCDEQGSPSGTKRNAVRNLIPETLRRTDNSVSTD